jgi:hypothetical protein
VGEEDEEVSLESLERKYSSARPEADAEREYEDPAPWAAPPADQPDSPGLLTMIVRVVLWLAAIAAGFYVVGVFWDGLEAAGYGGDASQRWLPFAGLVVLAGAVFLLLRSYRTGPRREALMVPAVLVGAVLATTGFMVYNSRDNGQQVVRDYCSYGARSAAQWLGCVRAVTPGEVVYSDTPAADFANGKSGDCGADSGPFCGEAARGREYRQALGELEREGSQEVLP